METASPEVFCELFFRGRGISQLNAFLAEISSGLASVYQPRKFGEPDSIDWE